MASGNPTNADLERQLKEMKELLRKKDDEMERKEEEMEKEREEARKEREEARKEREEAKNREEELRKTRENWELEKKKSRAKEVELARFRRQPPGNIGFVDEGSMEWKVEVKEVVEAGVYSPYSSVGNVPFRLCCKSATKSGINHLAIFLRCDDQAFPPKRFAKVTFALTLKSSISSESCLFTPIFDHSMLGNGYDDFIPWLDAVDPSKGYVQNDRFIIEAQIKLIWYYKNAYADFSSPDPQLSDVTLIVGGKKFHSSKNYLAHFSEFFKALFYSGFAEKNKDTVELPEVDAKEFEGFLRMIHVQRVKAKVAKGNVEYLLRLADFFDVPFVLWGCIDYLKESTDFSLAAKLQFTEEYRLPELQDHLIGSMKSADDVKRVITSPDFADFSETLQNFLHAKHFKLFFPN